MIFNPKGKQNKTENSKLECVMFFDKEGKAHVNDKYYASDKGVLVSEFDNQRYAKAEIFSDGTKKCFLKTLRGGRIGEVVVDPWSLLGTDRDMAASNDMYATRMSEYALVKEQILFDYVEYLKKRNPTRIRDVERAFLNGEATA